MSDKRNTSVGSWWDNQESFNQVIALLIALVTLLAAIVALLQNDAGARDDEANRLAQQAAIQQMGQRISGEVKVGYAENDAYRTWLELDTLRLSADDLADGEAVQRYSTVQEKITALSPLLASPYFEPEMVEPDFARFEADAYVVDTTRLSEQFTAYFAVKLAWDEKANTYILHLTILAVALFLFGLATTITSRVRLIFLGAGLFITLITLVWVVAVYLRPVPGLPERAIETYAQGVGLSYQERYEESVPIFTQALAIAPTYANAYYERGLAYYNLGNHEAAIADYTQAQAAGRDNANTAWDLGWSYYLLGRFDEAAAALRHALELDSNLVGARLDLGLALLAAGQVEDARNEYAQALELAGRQVAEAEAAGQEPPASLWTFMDYGSQGLVDLLDSLNSQPRDWTEAPPAEAVVNPDTVQAAAVELLDKVESSSVALEFTGRPLAGQTSGRVSPFEFAEGLYDEDGELVDYNFTNSFPFGTNEVLVLFDYEGMKDGQAEIWKVYLNGQEDPSWRVEETWQLGESGGAEKALSYAYSNVYVLSAGEYTVELYVDHHLVQRGRFTILEEEE